MIRFCTCIVTTSGPCKSRKAVCKFPALYAVKDHITISVVKLVDLVLFPSSMDQSSFDLPSLKSVKVGV